MTTNNIIIDGFRGKWHVIDENEYNGELVYLMEHSTYGDETCCLIVDENFNLILDDVWNGWDDLWDMEDDNISEFMEYGNNLD